MNVTNETIITWESVSWENARDSIKPHQHAEVIRMWALGHKIEFLRNKNGVPTWTLLHDTPMWADYQTYRVYHLYNAARDQYLAMIEEGKYVTLEYRKLYENRTPILRIAMDR